MSASSCVRTPLSTGAEPGNEHRGCEVIMQFSWTRRTFLAALTSVLLTAGSAWAQDVGGDSWQSAACGACHTIGGGRLIGPDLSGVHQRRSQEWLEQFVRSSQTLIQSGHAEAVAVFEEYNGLLMPDPPITDTQVKQVLASAI